MTLYDTKKVNTFEEVEKEVPIKRRVENVLTWTLFLFFIPH